MKITVSILSIICFVLSAIGQTDNSMYMTGQKGRAIKFKNSSLVTAVRTGDSVQLNVDTVSYINTKYRNQLFLDSVNGKMYSGYTSPTPLQLVALTKYLTAGKSTIRPVIGIFGDSWVEGQGATTLDSVWSNIFARQIQDLEGSPRELWMVTNTNQSLDPSGGNATVEKFDSTKCGCYAAGGGFGGFGIVTGAAASGFYSCWTTGIVDYTDMCIVAPNGGTYTVTKNGATIRTVTLPSSPNPQFTYSGITTNGTNTPDASPVSASYSQTITGNNIQVISIIRNRAKVYDANHRPFTFMHIAHSGWTYRGYFTSLHFFGNAFGDSSQTKGWIVDELGLNDVNDTSRVNALGIITTPTEAFRSFLTAFLDTCLTYGIKPIKIMPYITTLRPNLSIYDGIIRDEYGKRGMVVIENDATPYDADGHVPDHTHGDNTTNRGAFNVLVKGLANASTIPIASITSLVDLSPYLKTTTAASTYLTTTAAASTYQPIGTYLTASSTFPYSQLTSTPDLTVYATNSYVNGNFLTYSSLPIKWSGGTATNSGGYSTAIGYGSGGSSAGNYSFSGGAYTSATGIAAFAHGYSLVSPSNSEAAFGTLNQRYTTAGTLGWNVADRAFSVGINQSYDGLNVWNNGTVGINMGRPRYALDIHGYLAADSVGVVTGNTYGVVWNTTSNKFERQLLSTSSTLTFPTGLATDSLVTELNGATRKIAPISFYIPFKKLDKVLATTGQTAFTITFLPLGDVAMHHNGVLVDTGLYTVSGKNITYTQTEFAAGDNVTFDYIHN